MAYLLPAVLGRPFAYRAPLAGVVSQGADDEQVRDAIKKFRTDRRSRIGDTTKRLRKRAKNTKARVLSHPLMVAFLIFTGRASFLYDIISDALVARAFYLSGHPMWCVVTGCFILTPYLGIMYLLRSSMTKKLADKTRCSLRFWRAMWPCIAMPFTLVLDVALNLRYMFSDPESAEVFHYMTLRQMLELVEGSSQVLFQGYIYVRLLNPGNFMPQVTLDEDIDIKMLGISVLFSMKGAYTAYTSLKMYAGYQTGGNKLRFFTAMTKFGEGFAPSHFFMQLGQRKTVTIHGAWSGTSDNELKNLGRAARASPSLEELRIHDAGWLTDREQITVNVAVQHFLEASRLKHFELRGADMTSATISKVKAMSKYHPHLQHAECEGVEEEIRCDRNARIRDNVLLRAVLDGNVAVVERESSTSHDSAIIAEALALAAEENSLQMMKSLLKIPGALNAVNDRVTDRYGTSSTPLCYASGRMEAFVVELLHLARADVNTPNDTGKAPLHRAAVFDNAEAVEKLLASRANVDCREDSGATPMSMAVQSNSVASVKKLVAGRADLNMGLNNGATPISIGSENNNTECVKTLIEARADFMKANENGATPVFIAAQNNSIESLERLLVARANPHQARGDGTSPVYIAAQKNFVESLQQLLAVRADPCQADNMGRTPVFATSIFNSVEALSILLAARADPNRPTNRGTRPVTVAAQQNNTEVVASLLAARADPDPN